MIEPSGSIDQFVPPSREISACAVKRSSGCFCGLYNSIQLSVSTEYVVEASAQFQLDWGKESTSLIFTIPGMAGAGMAVPETAGGTSGAQVCENVVAAAGWRKKKAPEKIKTRSTIKTRPFLAGWKSIGKN